MLNWIKSIFGAPQPSGPPETIRRFRTTDPTISQGCITVAQDGWVVDAREAQTIVYSRFTTRKLSSASSLTERR